VEAHALHKSYGSTTVLDGLDLAIDRGTVFALLGSNGAGKTTTVRILSTLTSPDGGRATVAGHDVVRESRAVRAAISVTGQNAAVDELLTAEENLRMVGRLWRLGAAGARRRADELIERFDLADVRSRRVRTFSGGMRRKVDLAMSLVGDPQVLFLDEPTTGLDPRSRQSVWSVISDLVADDVTVVLTTQYLEEAERLADRVAVMDGGRVIAEGTVDALKRQVGTEQVELVLASSADLDRAARALDVAANLTEGGHLSVASDGTAAHVRHLLNTLERHGVDVATIRLHRPSLDDVFLTLTGSSTGSSTVDRAEEVA